MTKEKVYLHGLVSPEFLQCFVGGVNGVVELFEDAMVRWADRNDFCLMHPPKVLFRLPDFDSPWYSREYIIVDVVSRGVRVMPIKQIGDFACWSEFC